MELVKINHEDFGIEESKAKQISEVFKPMLEKMYLEVNELIGKIVNHIKK